MLQFAQFISGKIYEKNRVLQICPIVRPPRM